MDHFVVAYDDASTKGALTAISVAGGLGRPLTSTSGTVYLRAGGDADELGDALRDALE